MNNENLDTPIGDPAWDYYVIWHSCQHVKAKIDVALKIMRDSENATPDLDEELHQALDLASDRLIDIVQVLEPNDD